MEGAGDISEGAGISVFPHVKGYEYLRGENLNEDPLVYPLPPKYLLPKYLLLFIFGNPKVWELFWIKT